MYFVGCYLQTLTDINETMTVLFMCVFSQYMWGAEDQVGLALDLKDIISPADNTSPSLELRPGVLQPGHSYTFTVNVSEPERGRWGSASVALQTKALPRGGLCVLSPVSDILLLETVVTYDCSGNNAVPAVPKPLCSLCLLH